MLTLIVIGLLAGIVTGLSPCILPVLPAVLATTAVPAGFVDPVSVADVPAPVQRWRPFVVIGGLVASFAVFTLIGASLLSGLGLPADLLRTVGLVAMLVMGVGLLVPAVGHVLERPFARLGGPGPWRGGSAFLFGATLGLAFVPCAGPVLATITVLASTRQVGSGLVALTLAFSLGVAIPLLAFALAGQQMATRIRSVRTHTPVLRQVTGGILVATSLAVWFGVADQAQRVVPGYVANAQALIEDNATARDALGGLSREAGAGTSRTFDGCERDPSVLADCGPARPFAGIHAWLNTADGAPLTLEGLRGRVVLVDFWTYSCINCQRTLPYLTAWDTRYREDGLTIVGVHSPEFAFEHDVGNVADQAAALGVRYPVAIDNDFHTWRAYNQRYWPAHYLIDRSGEVRQVHYGEGAYAQTESLIRALLADGSTGGAGGLPPPTTSVAPETAPTFPITPETYLGFFRADAYANADLVRNRAFTYQGPEALLPDLVALDGQWTLQEERITAGPEAQLRLHFTARKVFLVLGGTGDVEVTVAGRSSGTVQVAGAPTLYPLVDGPLQESNLELTFTPGISAYAFTFG